MNKTYAVTRRAFTLLGALAPLAACAGPQSQPRSGRFDHEREYRGPLVDPAQIPGDFMWEQRIIAQHGKTTGGFDAVIQKKGNQLLVLGLAPMKTRAFALTQTGTEFEFEQFVPFELPFSPEAILFDIHRAFFYELLGEFPERGERRSHFEDELLTDQFHGGRLVRRVFTNVAASTEKLIIEYAPAGYARTTPPEVTKLENFAYGYSLTVETTSARAL